MRAFWVRAISTDLPQNKIVISRIGEQHLVSITWCGPYFMSVFSGADSDCSMETPGKSRTTTRSLKADHNFNNLQIVPKFICGTKKSTKSLLFSGEKVDWKQRKNSKQNQTNTHSDTSKEEGMRVKRRKEREREISSDEKEISWGGSVQVENKGDIEIDQNRDISWCKGREISKVEDATVTVEVESNPCEAFHGLIWFYLAGRKK